ncbi:MAG: hypothetical protein UV79_C0001G0018 [candidate division TM6 bacterium GW2011_GWF2_43_17]|nr:MAG: hypothetical protein UV79_C0001G0018 [candidate division TM6 bacterium GW2011_GWF2_43_17]HAU30136.1 50S ribosomal protein L29 [Candidatus Dependentiae bacterium]
MKEISNKELNSLSLEQLALKSEELRRDLFQLRLKEATSPTKSFSSDQRKLKRSVARVLTCMNEKFVLGLRD